MKADARAAESVSQGLGPPLEPERDLAAALAAYRARGAAPLGPVISGADAARLAQRADAIMRGEVRYEGLFFQHDAASGRYEDLPLGEGWVGPSLGYRKVEKLERDPLFWALITSRLFERVATAVLGPDVTLYRAVLFNKPPGSGSPIPWHQDGGSFWGVDRDPVLQIWVALDDIDASCGCVSYLPETHRAGLATPLGGVVPEDRVAAWRSATPPPPDEIALPARAGEALLIHNQVWHRSGPNPGERRRRAFTVCFLDARTRCLRKKRAPRTFVPVFSAAPR